MACFLLTAVCATLGLLGSLSALPAPRPQLPWPVNFTRPDPGVGEALEAWVRLALRSVNPEELGTYFQGDIMLPASVSQLTRNGINYVQYRWPGALVPYAFEATVSSTARTNVLQAMKNIEAVTCVRFIARTTEVDYVSVERANSGCWSYIGKKGGKQELNLQDPGCTAVGTATHELMHALGFFHEHTRDDRDQFVTIQWPNIQPGKENNFDIWPYSKTTYGTAYDYGSILHYSAGAFSSNGLPTIVTKDATAKIGQRTAMTSLDIQLINSMYSCSPAT